MSKPDEDPPVTGGRDLPESLVWRPSKLSEGEIAEAVECTCGLCLKSLSEHILWQAIELAAKDEEIRRLREAMDDMVSMADGFGVNEHIWYDSRAAKALEPLTKGEG